MVQHRGENAPRRARGGRRGSRGGDAGPFGMNCVVPGRSARPARWSGHAWTSLSQPHSTWPSRSSAIPCSVGLGSTITLHSVMSCCRAGGSAAGAPLQSTYNESVLGMKVTRRACRALRLPGCALSVSGRWIETDGSATHSAPESPPEWGSKYLRVVTPLSLPGVCRPVLSLRRIRNHSAPGRAFVWLPG